jgi:hypothetical protein
MSKLAYTYAEAAEATGYSQDVIQRAVSAADMVASYANSKPVITARELERWVESLPHVSPRDAKR